MPSMTQEKAGICHWLSPQGAREKRLSASPQSRGGNCSQSRATTKLWADRMSDGEDDCLDLGADIT